MRLDSPPMRIDVATGQRRPIPGMGKISSGQFWKGLRLEGLSAGPGEHAEGYATQHFICVLGSAVRVENSWPGGRRKVRQYLAGHVGLIPAMMPTANRWESFRATALFLDPELLSAGAGHTSRGRIELRPAMDPQEDALLKELALVLRKEVQSGYPGGALYGESLGAAITAHVVRRYAVAPCGAANLRGAMAMNELRRIEEYVEEKLATSLSLQELAQQVDMNVYCFVRAFKRSREVPAARPRGFDRRHRAPLRIRHAEPPHGRFQSIDERDARGISPRARSWPRRRALALSLANHWEDARCAPGPSGQDLAKRGQERERRLASSMRDFTGKV